MCVRQCYTLVDYLFMQNAVMNIINFTNEYLYSALYNIHCSRMQYEPGQPVHHIRISKRRKRRRRKKSNECELSRRDTSRHRFNVVIFRHWVLNSIQCTWIQASYQHVSDIINCCYTIVSLAKSWIVESKKKRVKMKKNGAHY